MEIVPGQHKNYKLPSELNWITVNPKKKLPYEILSEEINALKESVGKM